MKLVVNKFRHLYIRMQDNGGTFTNMLCDKMEHNNIKGNLYTNIVRSCMR